MKAITCGFCAPLWLALCASAYAVAGPSIDESKRSVADVEWAEIQAQVRNFSAESARRPDKTARGADDRIARQLQLADRLRQFSEAYPEHAEAAEARRQEVLSLLRAGTSGDDTRSERRALLTEAVLSDQRVPAAKRFDVAAYAFNLPVIRSMTASRVERYRGLELAAKKLIAAFPDDPRGYQSLFAIASDGARNDSARIVGDLLRDGKTPPAVRDQAEQLRQRHALLGSPAAEMIVQALGDRANEVPLVPGNPTVLCFWNTRALTRLREAARIIDAALIGATVLNIDLDGGVPGQTSPAVLGRGLRLSKAQATALADALHVERDLCFVVIDGDGCLREMSARIDRLLEALKTGNK